MKSRRLTTSRNFVGHRLRNAWFAAVMSLTGCAAFHPVEGIPARFVPEEIRAPSRSGKTTIDLSLLSRTQPDEYRLDTGDVLAVYVEGVLPRPNELPPTHMPQLGEEASPALGFPIPVRHDGSISLPLLTQSLPLRGLTVKQAEETVRAAYTTGRKILQSGNERVWVILHKPRVTRVLVIRQEGADIASSAGQPGAINLGALKRGTGKVVTLAGYKNDVLHAIAETGGLPGLDAQNMIYVIRTKRESNAHGNTNSPVPFGSGFHGNAPAQPGLSPIPRMTPSASGLSPHVSPNPTLVPMTSASRTSAWPTSWNQPATTRPTANLPTNARSRPKPTVRGQSPEPFGSYTRWPGQSNNSRVQSADYGIPAGTPIHRVWPVTESAAATPVEQTIPPESTRALIPMLEPQTQQSFSQNPQQQWSPPAGWPPTWSPESQRLMESQNVVVPWQDGHHGSIPNGQHLPEMTGDAWMRQSGQDVTISNPSVIKIPVRLDDCEQIHFSEHDVILEEGDIVFIESRDTEIFYTGGLLGGGQFTLPRDYDLDVLGAIAIAQAGRQQTGSAARAAGGVTALNSDVTISGSELIILRKMPNGTQVPIKVDLYRAVRHPEDRILIQPGDYVLLQYTPIEAVGAFFERHLLEGALFGLASTQLSTGNR